MSTQSATVPSGKANGARNAPWAKASGSDERAEHIAPPVPATGRRLRQHQRAPGQLDDPVHDALLLVAVAVPTATSTGGAVAYHSRSKATALGVP